MKPNNLIYRSIANKITGITFEKFYSSMYYMRAIAEYYNGEPYTGRKPSNKYIKDWYIGLTGESEPETHKYNLWYLREIVKFYDSQQSGLNENQCLSFIDDQVEPPSPVEFDGISLTVANSILSYADGDTATLTAQLTYQGEEAHLSGKSVSFDIVDGQGTVISHIGSDDTDSDGSVTITYTSLALGNIIIQASVEGSSETYIDRKNIRDLYYVNIGDTDKSSDFDLTNLMTCNNKAHGTVSITHSNDHYAISVSGAGNYSGIPIPKISALDRPFKMTLKAKGTYRGIYCENGNVLLYHYTPSTIRLINAHKTQNTWAGITSSSIGNITELRLEFINNSGALSFKAYDGDTEVYSHSLTNSTYDNTTNNVNFGILYHNATDIEIKDIIVELL